MSWDSYVDNVISHAGGHVTQACILGLNGSVWTPKTKDSILNISQAEATAIGRVMSMKSGVGDAFAGTGIVVDGTKYMFLRDLDGDGKIILGKKQGKGAVTMQSTAQGVIIAFVPEGSQQGEANKAVDIVAKYLESVGY